MALSVQECAVGSKHLLKTRSSPGLPEWVASAQKVRLPGRPLHKKLRFKPEGESRWEREAPSLHLYLASVNLAPSVLSDLQKPVPVCGLHIGSVFPGAKFLPLISFPGLNFSASLGAQSARFLAFWWATLELVG